MSKNSKGTAVPPKAVNHLGRLVYEPQTWRQELGSFGGRVARYKQSRHGLIRAFDPVRNCNVAFKKPIHFEHWLSLFLDPEVGEIEIYPEPLQIIDEGRVRTAHYHFRWCRLSDGKSVLDFVAEPQHDEDFNIKQYAIAAAHNHQPRIINSKYIREQKIFIDNCDHARRLMTSRIGLDCTLKREWVLDVCRSEASISRQDLLLKLFNEDELDYALFWLYRQGFVRFNLKEAIYGNSTWIYAA
jgi:hypothetical protein